MLKTGEFMVSKRTRTKYAKRRKICGQPVAEVKSKNATDYVTAEEFVEELYGIPVDHIVFMDGSCSAPQKRASIVV